MSGIKSKQKGNRREREFAKLIGGTRVPLSGAIDGYANDVKGLGLEWEVKARKSGCKTLYGWLEDEREQQDADLIAFLYRDDYYNKDSEAKNIIEVIIGKQRNGPIGTVELAFVKEFNKFVDLERAVT